MNNRRIRFRHKISGGAAVWVHRSNKPHHSVGMPFLAEHFHQARKLRKKEIVMTRDFIRSSFQVAGHALNQVQFACKKGCVRPVARVKFTAQGFDVQLYCDFLHVQILRDFLVGLALAKPRQDVTFSLGEQR